MPVEPKPADETIPLHGQRGATVQVNGYDVLSELGRGGMGVVYRARQRSLDRVVALKVLVAGARADADQLARFHTEAEVVARLQHPHIVQVYEVGETEGCPFLSLEFLSGGSLAEFLMKQPVQPNAAAQLVRTLALAIQAAHAANIIHRDLKPANILLAADGSPKIADFGLAKHLGGSQLTRTGAMMGTPSYMAPEQAVATKDVGPACDIYSLGAILYELLSGGPPFRGPDAMEVIVQVLHQDPVSIRRLAPGTPRDLETICLKCLEKQPHKRYLTAQDLVDDLTRYLEGHTIRARAASPPERAWKWICRRPALAGLFAVTALSLGSFIAYGIWKNRELSQALETTAKARDRAEGNLRYAIEAASRRISRRGDASTNPLVEELAFMEQIRSQKGTEPAIQQERGLAAGWAGYIHSELNDRTAAEKAFQESMALFEDLTKRFPENDTYRRDLANFIARHAAFLARTGDDAGAKMGYVKAVEILEQLHKRNPGDIDIRFLLAAEYNDMATVTSRLGEDTEPHHRRAIELRQNLVKDFPSERRYRYDLTVSQMNLTAYQFRAQRYADAEAVLRDCIRELEEMPPQLKAESEYRRVLAAAHLNLGYALEHLQKLDPAAASYALGVQQLEQLAADYPQSVPIRQMLIDASNNLSKVFIAQSKFADAIAPVDRVGRIYSELVREFPDNAEYSAELAKSGITLEQLRQAANEKSAE